uniref:DUF1501 domain-containing protein n=1 Tax=uncultured Acidobacteria bacterium A2 TaxID=1036852 RepID=F8TTF6_9BACT|nr:hypothetical protein [uncultured Acidobacteria bacterium A2]
MLDLITPETVQSKCDGSSRRDFMKIGTLGLFGGLTLPQLLRAQDLARAEGKSVKKKSIILLFLDGGASHIETFDPKMDAPKEYRSLFDSVQTSLPGIHFGGLIPKFARLAKEFSFVRSFTHEDGDHGGATHWLKTGYPWPPEFKGKAPIIPQTHPSIGSMVARYRSPLDPQTGVPNYVRILSNHQGYPGDDAAWLGHENNPFKVRVGGGGNNPMLANMGLKVAPEQLDDRRKLLSAFDSMERTLDHTGTTRAMDAYQQQAVNVITGKAKQAFDIDKEDPKLREKYGKGLGEELLLARRLCEAGAGFVTINNGYWDHHGGIIPGMKSLCPPLDQAIEAYVEDVKARGLQDDILLIVTGEFGRTPRINGGPGRDHWAGLNPLAFFGGGLKMGQVIGDSDARAAFPRIRPIYPLDFMATIFKVLDIPLDLQYVDKTGRPRYMIEEGKPIEELL